MPTRPRVLPRSFLYVPGNKPELFSKASTGPADALILDLEDAVPLAAKAQARNDIRGWLTKHSRPEEAPRSPRQQSWVRINGDSTAPDLDTVTVPGLAGVFLAKCTVDSLHETATFLDALESSRGLEAGSVSIIGLIESAAALQQIDKITRVRRLTTLAIGEVDLMADLRMTRSSRSEPALDSLRTRLVVSCAAAELLPPVAPTSTAFRELDDFVESSLKMHALGFRSRTAIHPSQVPVIHDVFTPDDAAIAAAQDVIEQFRRAGDGVATDASGRMIDAAVARGAMETLQRSSLRTGRRDPSPAQPS